MQHTHCQKDLVKEMILPEYENPGPSHTCWENVSGFGSDDFNKMKETTNNATSLIIGDHEVKSIGRLVKVEKKVQEPYYKGTKERKRSKKKVKQQRGRQCVNELLLEESQNKTKEMDVQNPSKESLTFEEIIGRVKLQEKIKEYEKFKKQTDRKNQIKQRLAEEKYIEKYENLAETWLNLLRKRDQLKQEGSTNLQHVYKECCNSRNNRITISLISRKYWNEEEDVKPKLEEKSECKQKETKEIKELREGIEQELVFVDESSQES